jgi:N utilization substance protein B
MMDFILMKMAVVEMLYFPEIPVKVTINEYIELAKLYSTPKSGEFINGILDRSMKQLKEENRIQKSGRGMQEE